jgi:hypothetical protein
LKGYTFEQRYDWINNKKEEGNKHFKAKEYDKAIEVYTSALCGFDFGNNLNEDDKESVNKDLMAPILNNMALCLMK